MKVNDLRTALHEGADVIFQYKGLNCGVFPALANGKMEYTVCFGDDDFSADSVDAALRCPLFDGKELSQICDQVEIDLQ